MKRNQTMLLEEANKTLIDNAILGAMLSNTDLSEADLALLSKWDNEPMTKDEFVKLLDILHLQILSIG